MPDQPLSDFDPPMNARGDYKWSMKKLTRALIRDVILQYNRLLSCSDTARKHRVSKQYVHQLATRLRREGFPIPRNPVRKDFKLTRIIRWAKEKYPHLVQDPRTTILPDPRKGPKGPKKSIPPTPPYK